ncbi:multiple epidermal growth factor domains 10, partial [Biomphalaria glabrata]
MTNDDLATIEEASITVDRRRSSYFLKDNNDKTCDDYVAEVRVSWNREYMLTWVRLVMREIKNDLNIKILFKVKGSQVFKVCSQRRIHHVSTKILDVWCLDVALVREVKIEGNLGGLCSLHISGGHNFAYKQNAVLSSNYGTDDRGDKAVDGNRNPDYSKKSCAHSGTHENYPKLTLTLSHPVVITRVVLYNRNKHEIRLMKFILQLFKKNDHIWYSYQNRSDTPLPTYTIIMSSKEQTEKMSITATEIDRQYNDKPIITLCEVEAYGECSEGYWGLLCTNKCPKECSTNCHIENGQCNTICFGNSDLPVCQAECALGQWGINCKERCSNVCHKSSCNRISGICDQGCLGYSDPPTCRFICSRGRWGINCSQRCSHECLNSSCNASTGHCDKGCLGYSNPPLCNLTCSSGEWGVNCSQTCSERCYNSSCNQTNGVCDQGCLGYNDPPQCNSTCFNGLWGLNCSQTCPEKCLNSSCLATSGECDQSFPGYSK